MLVVADSTVDALAGYLGNFGSPLGVDVTLAPYDQVRRVLGDPTLDCWGSEPRVAIVWTLPHKAVASFGRLLAYESVALDALLAEVDEFAAALLAVRARCPVLLAPTWIVPPVAPSLGLLDFRRDGGVAHALLRMNLRLADRLADARDIYLLDASRWAVTAGAGAFNPKLWYVAKGVYGLPLLREAARDMVAALRAICGLAVKLVVVDLDDTLWGGIVGDIGWENLRLGGHDAVGEAFVDFQRALRNLKNRGVLLAIASKNEEHVALEALRRHPEMVLRPEDFTSWRINWGDKAANILDIVQELNLGLDATMFIDDNPVERDRVREALPSVLVPDWPSDPTAFRDALFAQRCFDTVAVTAEDRARTESYRVDRERALARQEVSSMGAWLESLELQVEVQPWTEHNAQRIVQLLNKTNQMNMRTRRLTESELRQWLARPGARLWSVRVADRFGDSGLTGIVSVEVRGDWAEMIDFVLSCRVMGRSVEESMCNVVVRWAQGNRLRGVRAEYLPTAKNAPCLRFLQNSGFAADGFLFSWSAQRDYPLPAHVRLKEVSETAPSPTAHPAARRVPGDFE